MNIVITMAGRGYRFRASGYTVPKYEIEVCGRSLFSWSLLSLINFIQPGNRFIFICLRELHARTFIIEKITELGIDDWDIVELDNITDGQATSVLSSKPLLYSNKSAFLVYNIDTYVEPKFLLPAHFNSNCWIPCFEGQGEAWSFVRLDSKSRIVEVCEKKPISRYATIGLYGFSSFELYEEAYNMYFADPSNFINGERYIAPMYNQIIAQGHEVTFNLVPSQAVHILGTPFDVEQFAALIKL